MKISELLFEAKFRQPIVMFHGTSTAFLRSILKNGIVPNPSQRKWDTDDQEVVSSFSRVSLPGSYWTSNLLTATGAAHNTSQKFGGGDMVVIARISEQSAYADEDNVNSPLCRAAEATVRALHPNIRADFLTVLGYDLFEPGRDAERAKTQEIFAAALHDCLEGSDRHPVDRGLMDEILDTLVIRNIAFETRNSWDGKCSWVPNPPPIPSIREIEAHLLGLRERLTRSYRISAYQETGGFSHTLRIELPVGFRGANRILAVVEIPRYRWEGEGEARKMIVDPLILHYGTSPLPSEFLDHYRNRKGPFPGLVDGRGRRLAEPDPDRT
jgi:hypothetical protein